jgi:hypothetical protein
MEEALLGAVEGVPRLECAWLAGDLDAGTNPVYFVAVGDLEIEDIDGIHDRAKVALSATAARHRFELAFFRPIDWEARIASGDSFAGWLIAEQRIGLCPLKNAEAN